MVHALHRMPRFVAALSLIAALAAGGCADSPTSPPAAPAVLDPDSPAAVIRQLEQAWNERDTLRVARLLTDDFAFMFAVNDTAGNAYRTSPWSDVEELRACRNLFVGGSTQPPASRITVSFDRTLIDLADRRPGRDPAVHRTIFSTVSLTVQIDDGGTQSSLEVQGYAKFFVVRGDSARVDPPAGAGRWFLERWEDETLPSGANRTNPAQSRTWGSVKARYL